MPKIGTVVLNHLRKSTRVDVHYTQKNKFYINLQDDWKNFNQNKGVVFGESEEQVRLKAQKVYQDWMDGTWSIRKVIVYRVGTQEERDSFYKGSTRLNAYQVSELIGYCGIDFAYRVLWILKVGDVEYIRESGEYDPDATQEKYPDLDYHERQLLSRVGERKEYTYERLWVEVDHTYELEEFCRKLSQTMAVTINKIKEFFGEDHESLMLSITQGKNLLGPSVQ